MSFIDHRFDSRPVPPTQRSRSSGFVLGAAAALAFVVTGPARAQNDEALPPLNFAFATQLGSGVYDSGGRIVQIYRIPISWTLRESEGHPFGVKLTLPTTLGFFDFRTSDLIGGDLPDNVGTLSVVPGVELEFPIVHKWWLTPFAEAGYATDFENMASALAYAGGIKSLALFHRPSHGYRLGNVLKYVGFTETEDWDSEGYIELDTGIELRHPVGFRMKKQRADLGWFAVDYFYLHGLKFDGLEGGEVTLHNQIEIGVTLGTEHTIKVWKFPVPRFGFSYRFGDGISAVRFVLGAPF